MDTMVQSTEQVSFESDVMQVVCDPNNSRFKALVEKMEGFYKGLDEDERRYVQFVSTAADIEAIRNSDDLLNDLGTFEDRIRDMKGESEFQPMAATPVIISLTRATLYARC
jgi:hypothetical protein